LPAQRRQFNNKQQTHYEHNKNETRAEWRIGRERAAGTADTSEHPRSGRQN
jgi:hypothetical protein